MASRKDYADCIAVRLEAVEAELRRQFAVPGQIATFVVDELLPEDMARELYAAFPAPQQMMRKHSLKESKYVAAQLDRYAPCLEEITFAFQDPRVMALFERITEIKDLLPDPKLYAGGISLMVKNGFLNPHLDNSHDGEQKRYRVLNSLYYVTPDWPEHGAGGNLELWDRGLDRAQRTIWSKFNRLVMMATHRSSWHSVGPLRTDARRCCVSNYYFREQPIEGREYFHATSFRGRPEQRVRDLVLRLDAKVRTRILSVVNVPNPHIYKK